MKTPITKTQLNRQDLNAYVNKGEKIVGQGIGGSESIVLYISKSSSKEIIVRKIWNDKIVSSKWDVRGVKFMTPPVKKGLLQVKFLKNLPEDAKPYFPRVYNYKYKYSYKKAQSKQIKYLSEVVCDLSYIPGIEISSFIAKYKPAPDIVAKLYIEIFRCLRDKIHSQKKVIRTNPTIETSYLNKIHDRINLSKRTIPSVFGRLTRDEYIWINEEKHFNIPYLLDKFKNPHIKNILEPKYLHFVMGDTNTENIKITNLECLLKAIHSKSLSFTYEELGIKFLDPRAIGTKVEERYLVDDTLYDSKVLHNALGNYDLIHSEFFNLKLEEKEQALHLIIRYSNRHPYKYSYSNLGKYFEKIMAEGWGTKDLEYLENDPFWIIRFTFIMGTHFAAMPPFHIDQNSEGIVIDDFLQQKRAVAIYIEGVKWLNYAYRMLNGEITRFLGVDIPPIKRARKLSEEIKINSIINTKHLVV